MTINVRKIGDAMDEYFETRSVYKCWSTTLGSGGYVWVRKEDVAFVEFVPTEEVTPDGLLILIALPIAHLIVPIAGESQLAVVGALQLVEAKNDAEEQNAEAYKDYLDDIKSKKPLGF